MDATTWQAPAWTRERWYRLPARSRARRLRAALQPAQRDPRRSGRVGGEQHEHLVGWHAERQVPVGSRGTPHQRFRIQRCHAGRRVLVRGAASERPQRFLGARAIARPPLRQAIPKPGRVGWTFGEHARERLPRAGIVAQPEACVAVRNHGRRPEVGRNLRFGREAFEPFERFRAAPRAGVQHAHHEVRQLSGAARRDGRRLEVVAGLVQLPAARGDPAAPDRREAVPGFARGIVDDLVEEPRRLREAIRTQVRVGDRETCERRELATGPPGEREHAASVHLGRLDVAPQHRLPRVCRAVARPRRPAPPDREACEQDDHGPRSHRCGCEYGSAQSADSASRHDRADDHHVGCQHRQQDPDHQRRAVGRGVAEALDRELPEWIEEKARGEQGARSRAAAQERHVEQHQPEPQRREIDRQRVDRRKPSARADGFLGPGGHHTEPRPPPRADRPRAASRDHAADAADRHHDGRCHRERVAHREDGRTDQATRQHGREEAPDESEGDVEAGHQEVSRGHQHRLRNRKEAKAVLQFRTVQTPEGRGEVDDHDSPRQRPTLPEHERPRQHAREPAREPPCEICRHVVLLAACKLPRQFTVHEHSDASGRDAYVLCELNRLSMVPQGEPQTGLNTKSPRRGCFFPGPTQIALSP